MIELRQVYKQYSITNTTATVLKNINLKINQGEFIAIMGPSGSGKTTLMNILGLLDELSSGEYYFENQNISHFSSDNFASLRNQVIGFVFQSFMLLPRMNLIENISLPLVYRGLSTSLMHAKAKEMLCKVGLSDLADRKPTELSGGQQQRVAIARALVTQPKIILADEPTGSLDTDTGQEIMNLLHDLHLNEQTTIVVVTHDNHIAQQCKRLIKIKNGSIEDV